MPKGKSLKEWVELYEAKTGDVFAVPEGYKLLYLAERGFASMKPDTKNKLMVVYQVCGDGKFWRDYAELCYAVPLGLDAVCTICTRDIRPYIRAFGWQILDEQMNDKAHLRFLCQDSIGRAVLITHKDYQDNGQPEYWVTHYCNRKACGTIKEFLKEVGA